MQGQLRKELLSFTITTECAHCLRPLHIDLDSELNYHLVETDAQPLVYAPLVNFGELDDPSIIDAF